MFIARVALNLVSLSRLTTSPSKQWKAVDSLWKVENISSISLAYFVIRFIFLALAFSRLEHANSWPQNIWFLMISILKNDVDWIFSTENVIFSTDNVMIIKRGTNRRTLLLNYLGAWILHTVKLWFTRTKKTRNLIVWNFQNHAIYLTICSISILKELVIHDRY